MSDKGVRSARTAQGQPVVKRPWWLVARSIPFAVVVAGVWTVLFVSRLVAYLTGSIAGGSGILLIVITGAFAAATIPSVVWLLRHRPGSSR
ncbi:hypothetical protein [Frondihabitans cladoniiphilus]|uniref:Uncharacterized protein n=1 Tax=Frondihabitans cladoniiphilus TaxID=715785 RepID=A0ABP8VNX2_9MICO